MSRRERRWATRVLGLSSLWYVLVWADAGLDADMLRNGRLRKEQGCSSQCAQLHCSHKLLGLEGSQRRRTLHLPKHSTRKMIRTGSTDEVSAARSSQSFRSRLPSRTANAARRVPGPPSSRGWRGPWSTLPFCPLTTLPVNSRPLFRLS
jgi:hypothetical protein